MTASDSPGAATKTLHLGFIGCGGNARGHMRRLGQLEGVQIVAVCDVQPALAEQAASQTGGQPYTDFRRLLDHGGLDAVYLSIPVFAHGDPEMAAVERGLPMFVEKPVAIDMGTAAQIDAAVARAGLLTCVGYQLRYCGSTDIARECLDAPEAGPIGIATGTYWCGTGRAQPDHWRTRMAQSGGQLVEQATHTIDMLRYLVGDVAEVYAFYGRQILTTGPGDCPDAYAVALRFTSGAVGTLSATWAIDPADWSLANLVDLAYGDRRLHWRTSGVILSPPSDSHQGPLTRQDTSIDEVFVNAVRRADPSAIRSPYADAVKSLAVSLAANESARTGSPVKLPLSPGSGGA
ncbi:MAG TPA: Gfo/Idh/MocA family oxidoreductase [Chloroflexota bacterium]|nr:Gfo/Idh/MocA family oxidoreductase [Chloroflexota bacterium]